MSSQELIEIKWSVYELSNINKSIRRVRVRVGYSEGACVHAVHARACFTQQATTSASVGVYRRRVPP